MVAVSTAREFVDTRMETHLNEIMRELLMWTWIVWSWIRCWCKVLLIIVLCLCLLIWLFSDNKKLAWNVICSASFHFVNKNWMCFGISNKVCEFFFLLSSFKSNRLSSHGRGWRSRVGRHLSLRLSRRTFPRERLPHWPKDGSPFFV